jgi:hypothetical protein
LAGLMECSAGWLQLLLRFCPATRHWPDRDSSVWPCALSVENNKRTVINVALGNDTLRFLMGIRILLLELGFAITLARICLAIVGVELRFTSVSDLLSLH